MRRLLIATALLLMPTATEAVPITYQVTGSVVFATQSLPISVGDSFTGLFTICPAGTVVPNINYSFFTGCLDSASVHAVGGTFSVNGYNFSFAPFIFDHLNPGTGYFNGQTMYDVVDGVTYYAWPDRVNLLLAMSTLTGTFNAHFSGMCFGTTGPCDFAYFHPTMTANIALTPVPEPTSLLLIASGATALFYRRRVRATERRP